MPTRHPRNPRRKVRFAKIGEQITIPPMRTKAMNSLTRGESIPVRTERAATVARWFGLDRRDDLPGGEPTRQTPPAIELPAPGEILLLSGPSGSGKSRLLRALRDQADESIDWIDLAELSAPPATPLVDCFGDVTPLREILLLFARVGLGEAWSYLRSAEELSEGQRFRLKLALALHRTASRPATPNRRAILVCDEFAAVLDRITAMVVARCLRRSIDANPHLSAIVASSHDDLQPALRPERIAWCDFGRVEWRRMGMERGTLDARH